MFGIVFAFRHLNRLDANAGGSYSWITSIFSPTIGFFAGWSVIVGSALFMVSGTLPAAVGTLKLFDPSLVEDQNAVTLIAAGWVAVIGAVVAKGIKLSSYTQIVFTVFEVGLVALLIVLVAVGFARVPAHAYSPASFTGAGFTPAVFAAGAGIALFAFSGWDVTVNLSEETCDGARIAGRGSIVAAAITVVLLVGFNAVALRTLTRAEIESAGVNIVFALAEKLMPHPWDYAAVIAVMLSTVGTLETSILQFTRTVFAMSRDNVLDPRYARLHKTYRTPWFATLLITVLGMLLLLLSSFLSGIKTVISDSVNAVGFRDRLLLRSGRARLCMAFPQAGANRLGSIYSPTRLAIARSGLLPLRRCLQRADLRYDDQGRRDRRHRNRYRAISLEPGSIRAMTSSAQ
jgi:amino acid transporter